MRQFILSVHLTQQTSNRVIGVLGNVHLWVLALLLILLGLVPSEHGLVTQA